MSQSSPAPRPSPRAPNPFARRVALYTAVAQGHDEAACYLADHLDVVDRNRAERVVSEAFGCTL